MTSFRLFCWLCTALVGCTSVSIHCVFNSLAYWTFKGTKLLIVGDVEVAKYGSETIQQTQDQCELEVCKRLLATWNQENKRTAVLLETNEWIESFNQRQICGQPLDKVNIGLHSSVPLFILGKKADFPNIDFQKCDKRGEEYFLAYSDIQKFIYMFSVINEELKKNEICVDSDFLQQMIDINMLQSKKTYNVKVQDFMNRFDNSIQEIGDSINSELDEITKKTLEGYFEQLQKEKCVLQEFFPKDISLSTNDAIKEYIVKQAELPSRGNKISISGDKNYLANASQKLLDIRMIFEKAVNIVAAAGFIRSLAKAKKEHTNIVLFCSNNHAVSVGDYLKKLQENDMAENHFTKGTMETYYGGPHKEKFMKRELVTASLCIPFSKIFVKKELQEVAQDEQKLLDDTRPYRCATCSKINLEKKLSRCSTCKKIHYCSLECQKTDWPMHKLDCAKK